MLPVTGEYKGGGVWVCVKARALPPHTDHTPSYLPSYTRLGHAIPGSKTVSVGCVCRARAHDTVNTTHRQPPE